MTALFCQDAVVRPNGTVEIRQIAINGDLGSTLEISCHKLQFA